MSVYTWLVRFEGKVLLIDTGTGNDKDRPTLKVLDHLHNPYLERLAAIGVPPEVVDYILLTHIHADHVGWNTRRDGNQWAPTFPNATVICSDLELRYNAALTAGDEESIAKVRMEAEFGPPTRIPVPGVFTDSMVPLAAEGHVRRVSVDGGEVLKGIRFIFTPGHSIDHAAISITSQGTEAIFGGDVMHHPLSYTTRISSLCSVNFPKLPGVHGAGLRATPRKGTRYTSAVFPVHFCRQDHQNGSKLRVEV